MTPDEDKNTQTQSTPISAQPSAPDPRASDPQTPQIPQGNENHTSSKKPILIAIIVVILLALSVLVYVLFLGGTKEPSKGPKLSVGTQPYVYACSVIDADTVAKELGFSDDKNKQGAGETYAFAPFNTTLKELDILKEGGRKNIPSTCELRYNRTVTTMEDGKHNSSFITVSATMQQYANEQDAKDAYEQSKASAKNAKFLSSFKDTSFYAQPLPTETSSTRTTIMALHKNILIGYSVPLGNTNKTADEAAIGMNIVHQDVVSRVDSGKGSQPKNYSGITKLGDSSFLDACQSTDFAKIGEAIDSGAEFDTNLFSSNQQFAPGSSRETSPESLLSVCNNYFRTKSDISAQATLSKEETQDESFVKYPHHLLVQVLTTKNSDDAQKIVTDFKKSGDSPAAKEAGAPTITDIKLGDIGVKVFTPADSASSYDGYLSYIAKDNHIYVISILMKKQSQPYQTTNTKITDDQMAQIYEALNEGAAYAARQTK